MNAQDWFVTCDGQCQPRPSAREWDLLRDPYYLHQFLSEVLEILANAPHEREEWDYLPQLRRQVRQLVVNSYWLKTQHSPPDTPAGTHVTTLYDEIGYPITVQNVTARPGVMTPIHNHGTWGIVCQLQGQDRHTFWRRTQTSDTSFQIDLVGDRVLNPGEILSFHPAAIHQVETVGDDNSLTFQLYGDTQPQGRFQFYPETQTAKPF
jgi:predicted metal-dependent enzyme (double-stranded beta helix superfamily)